MALLTADDVLNKKFQATKFREGYDQDEVDDFLDEVVNTLRAVETENEGLKDKLAAAERRVAELTRTGAASEAPVDAVAGGDEPSTTATATPAPAASSPAASPVALEKVAAPAPAEAAPAAAPARPSEPESVTGMLQMAQKLHDDYVRQGQEEGERLLAEARAQGTKILSEAEETSHRTLSQLEEERSLLERKIDELRVFERDYRTRLRGYLENLLGDLDNRGSALPPRAGQAAAGAPAEL